MVLGAQVGGQLRQQVQQDNVPLEEDVDNNIDDDDDDDDAVNNIIDPQQDVEDEIIIRHVADDEDNIAIINEEDIIIVNNDVIDEEEEAVDDPDPPPPVNCHTMNNPVEEDDDDDNTVLVDEEEEQQPHLINYAISLPVVATADAGRRERRNEEGLVELHEHKQFNAEARALACLYATYLMGWNKEHSRRGQEHVTLASCTLVCYDLGYKMVTGKYGLEQWLKQFKESIPNSTAKKCSTASIKVQQAKQKG